MSFKLITLISSVLALLLIGCRSMPTISTHYKDSQIINRHYQLHRLKPSFFASLQKEKSQKSLVSMKNLKVKKTYKVGPGIYSILRFGDTLS